LFATGEGKHVMDMSSAPLAARVAFEAQRTGRAPKSVTVVVGGDTLVA
jgi:hypothetical protein